MGNQIIRAAHWLAWAMDYPDEINVLNLPFWPYAPHFAVTQNNPGCRYPEHSRCADGLAKLRSMFPDWFLDRADGRIRHWVHRSGAILPSMQCLHDQGNATTPINLDGHDFYRTVKQCRITMCAGWYITGWDRVRKHREALRASFRLREPLATAAEKFVTRQRGKGGLVVGVLIRQGDYMAWQGGRFGFATKDYLCWMRQVLDIECGREVSFLITSDTWQDPAWFAGLPWVFSNGSRNVGGDAITSFAELSACDVILTPPSTFSASAAFIGGCSLWPLFQADQKLASDQLVHHVLLDEAFTLQEGKGV